MINLSTNLDFPTVLKFIATHCILTLFFGLVLLISLVLIKFMGSFAVNAGSKISAHLLNKKDWLIPNANTFKITKQEPRKNVNILVIDDQHRKFGLAKILSDKEKYSWISYGSVQDLKSLEEPVLYSADLVFIDIQGVGRFLTPRDEGLGLADEILKKYPQKKVVIYSSEQKQNFTHPVLSKVSGRLYKEDEPRNFIKYAEDVRDGK